MPNGGWGPPRQRRYGRRSSSAPVFCGNFAGTVSVSVGAPGTAKGAIDKCGIRLRLCFGGMGTRLLFAHLAGRGVLPILLLQPLLPVGLRRPLLGDGKADAAEKDQSERAGPIKIVLHVCASLRSCVRLAAVPCANECLPPRDRARHP